MQGKKLTLNKWVVSAYIAVTLYVVILVISFRVTLQGVDPLWIAGPLGAICGVWVAVVITLRRQGRI